MRIMPTKRNILFFALAYQIYPSILWWLVTFVNPSPRMEGVLGIFAFSQIALIYWILGWKRRAAVEIHDERETLVQLKVRSFMLDVATTVAILTTFISVGFYREMPAWMALTLVIVAILTAEQIGYRLYNSVE